MALNLMYITDDYKIAKIAEKSGVDWIFVDLEINGKFERQGHLDTVISKHSIDNVKKVKDVLTTSKLLVRVNPIFENSQYEINKVIEDGADIVMLPYFKTYEEVAEFVEFVDKRAKTILLLETVEAVEALDEILTIPGIDYIHVGLNDLHLEYGLSFMFELISNGSVESICAKINKANIPYGFGGIARLGHGDISAEFLIAEHYRLGSTMAILSRSFCNIKYFDKLDEIEFIFDTEVEKIRELESILTTKTVDFFDSNKVLLDEKIAKVIKTKEIINEAITSNRSV